MRNFDRSFLFKFQSAVNGAALRIWGTVENTGRKAWDNRNENRDSSFHVGVRVYRKNDLSSAVRESRFYLDGQCINPGERISFKFNMILFDLPPDAYIITLNILKESAFWFEDLGVLPEIIQHQVVNVSSSKEREIRYCTNPQEARVLFLAPSPPLYDRECGGNRLFNMVRLLCKNGFNVTYLCEPILPSHKKYAQRLTRMGIRCVDNPVSFLSGLKENAFTICVIPWYTYADNYLRLVRMILPKAKIIVDSVDVHWVREIRGAEAGELHLSSDTLREHKEREMKVYREADEVWATSENDRRAILKELPACNAKVVPLIYEKHPGYLKNTHGNGILFVGNFNHPPNESAAVWGYEIFQKFSARAGMDAVYYIVGNNPSDRLRALHDGKNVFVTGYVKNLHTFYGKSKAMIAPLKYGAGVKGKICDAICSGLPVITNDIGNEGLNLVHGKETLIANTSDEFVENLVRLFSGEVAGEALAKNALVKVLELTGERQGWNSMSTSLVYRPVVISIVSYNKKELLAKCVNSILDKTTYPNYTIAVVCNGCTDGSAELMRDLKKAHPRRIDFYYNDHNEYFVKPNNVVINTYRKADIVLVNNDVEIVSGDWLLHLYEAAYASQRVGAAGGKIVDGSGRISEAGAELYNDGTGRNIGRGEAPDNPQYNKQRSVGYVSGCLLYMRRDMIERFGALDEDFAPMYYEDAEWQYRLHKEGIRTVYTPQCVVVHREGSSAGTDISSGMKKYQEINRNKFLEKFRGIMIEALNP